MGVGEEVNMYILDLFFDNKIYLEKNSIISEYSSFNFSYDPYVASSIPICLGKVSSRCPKLPQALLNIAGILQLDCPSQNSFISSLPLPSKILPYVEGLGGGSLDFVVPFPPTTYVL